MGNIVIIPPVHDWYTQPLKKHGISVTNPLDCGTFFIVLQGRTSTGQDVVIKAYQYYEPLLQLPIVTKSISYFDFLEQCAPDTNGIVNFSSRFVHQNMSFLIRPKFDRSLLEFAVYQNPPLQKIEKLWIFYQIISSIMRLHAANLAHCDIKPSNIFISRTLSVLIADPAPFKPQKIDPTRPHLFYHFFTTGTDSGYCIAPERLSADESTEIDLMAADFFSIGCTIAYLYLDGRYLFDSASMALHSKREFDIDSALSSIGDQSVIQMIKGCLEIDPIKRKDLVARGFSDFPTFFKEFTLIDEFWTEQREKNELEFNQLLETALSKGDLVSTEIRLLLFDHILEDISNANFNLTEWNGTLRRIVKFMLPCSDEVKLARVIPLMVSFVCFEPTLLIRTAAFSVLELLKTVQKIPDELTGYTSFLKTELNAVCIKNPTGNTLMVFAELLPLIGVELVRLEPQNVKLFALGFTSVFTTHGIEVFKVFAKTLIDVRHLGRYRVLKAFLHSLFILANYQTEQFQLEILRILIAFYGDANFHEIRKYRKQCIETVLPICERISLRGMSDELHIALFELFQLLLKNQIVHSTYAFNWTGLLTRFVSSPNPEIRYWLSVLMKVFPNRATSRLIFTSVFEPIPPKLIDQSINNPQIQFDSEQVKLIDLNFSRKAHFRPHFISSSRIGICNINHIFQTESKRDYLVISNQNKVHYLTLPTDTKPIFRCSQISILENKITAGCSLASGTFFVAGFESGLIKRYATESMMVSNESQMNQTVTAIDYLTDNLMLAGSIDGTVSLFDFRAGKNKEIANDTFSSISDIAVWPNNRIIAGIGYKDGIVSIFDLRMWLPIWSDTTYSFEKLIPMAVDSPGLSYLVMNSECVEVVIEPRLKPKERPRTTFLYQERRRFRTAFSYLGGAVVIDDGGASFVHGNRGYPVVRLNDLASESLRMEPENGSWRIRRATWDLEGASDGNSVHQHQGNITCGTIVGDMVVTCDNLGFVHQWSLGHRVLARKSSG
jgi:serine/threonine protein kinase